MRASRHDPLHLDVAAFAAEGQQLSGQWPGSSLARLVEVQVPPQDGALAEVDWQAQGERLAVPGSEPEIWLTLTVSTPVWLTCQRCLQAMALPLTLNRRLRFVSGESQAEAMDASMGTPPELTPEYLKTLAKALEQVADGLEQASKRKD